MLAAFLYIKKKKCVFSSGPEKNKRLRGQTVIANYDLKLHVSSHLPRCNSGSIWYPAVWRYHLQMFLSMPRTMFSEQKKFTATQHILLAEHRPTNHN